MSERLSPHSLKTHAAAPDIPAAPDESVLKRSPAPANFESWQGQTLEQKLLEERRFNQVMQWRMEDLQRQVDKMRRSSSWIITQPLRTLGEILLTFGMHSGSLAQNLRLKEWFSRKPGASAQSAARKTMLMIDHYVPEPDRDAGSRNMANFIRVLMAEGYSIKFWPHQVNDPSYTPRLERAGVEVIQGEDYDRGLRSWLEQHGRAIDSVFLSRPDVADKYLEMVKSLTKARIVYYGHDIHHRRVAMQAELTQETTAFEEAARLERVEKHVWSAVDCVLYPSREEAAYVRETQPGASAAHVIPFAFDSLGQVDPTPQNRSGVLFVASYGHTPNVDAALWLVREIMPLIWRQFPETKLFLVGSYPKKEILDLNSDKIIVTGAVSEAVLQDYYRVARVAVVPLRFGAGVKAKVVEALNAGLPLVTTPVGMQGLENLDRVSAVQSTPVNIAIAILRFLKDGEAWKKTAAAQLAYAKQNFSFDLMRRQLLAAIQEPAAKS